MTVVERLFGLSSSDSGDAKSITDVILAELIKAGLTSSKIHVFSQVMMAHLQWQGTVEEFNVYCTNEKTERFLKCTA